MRKVKAVAWTEEAIGGKLLNNSFATYVYMTPCSHLIHFVECELNQTKPKTQSNLYFTSGQGSLHLVSLPVFLPHVQTLTFSSRRQYI